MWLQANSTNNKNNYLYHFLFIYATVFRDVSSNLTVTTNFQERSCIDAEFINVEFGVEEIYCRVLPVIQKTSLLKAHQIY